ncbi:MAG: type II toxin-antitoxin system RelE/ParE family toxin [Pirellulales bacterium]
MIVRYNELAKREVIETTKYYAELREGLGAEFRKELGEVVALIAESPTRFEDIHSGMRRCLLKRFPYGVYYRILDADLVEIVVVKHHSRRPGYGMRRK